MQTKTLFVAGVGASLILSGAAAAGFVVLEIVPVELADTTILIQGPQGDGSVFQEYVSFDSQLPAPGTLALLGFAGLLSRRRSRRPRERPAATVPVVISPSCSAG